MGQFRGAKIFQALTIMLEHISLQVFDDVLLHYGPFVVCRGIVVRITAAGTE